MTSGFDERREVLEEKFFHDADLRFKAEARRNRALGLWVAAMLGKEGEAATDYAKDVMVADLTEPGDKDVIAKIMADTSTAGIALDEETLRAKMQQLLEQAIADLQQGA